MEKILSEFGVQPILLAAQVVNFLILLFILKRFLYKPLLNVLQKRKDAIAESLKNAQEIEIKLAEAAKEKDKIIEEAAKQAEKIVNGANQAREDILEDSRKTGENLAQKIVEDAKIQMQLEQEKLRQAVRSDATNLVMLVFQKITGKTINKSQQKELIEKAVKEL